MVRLVGFNYMNFTYNHEVLYRSVVSYKKAWIGTWYKCFTKRPGTNTEPLYFSERGIPTYQPTWSHDINLQI
jgi:hypothetical protein